MQHYPIIVIGGGHAGVEAACVAARMGVRVGLITMDASKIGAMSCNPAIGGLGKGHLVREIDAFDGVLGRAADAGAIHYRMLNRSKGSAVWGPRVQADRKLFGAAVRAQVAAEETLDVVEGEAAALVLDGERVAGVELADGTRIGCEAAILCTGTFLGGVLFRGEETFVGGRVGEGSAARLAAQLREAALPMARLKTGTPPRLDGRTIDWSRLDEQPSDHEVWTMSPLSRGRANPQIFCAITRTNARAHEIIRANLSRSPLYSGAIGAQGPRYCPSIEDKIDRFGDRDGHQIFLEPEGLDTPLVYPNGISTSLPVDVQEDFLRAIDGLEQVRVVEPGYAVEYDHVDPRSLDRWLQMRGLPGLYCAGQINGTTGYEEAAAQGLVAGLHAASSVLGRDAPALDRANSYIAVMVDDLTLHGVTEPYRMLTARAEYRLRLRANNASTRLTPLAIEVGCVHEERGAWFEARAAARADVESALAEDYGPAQMRSASEPRMMRVGSRCGIGRASLASIFPHCSMQGLFHVKRTRPCWKRSAKTCTMRPISRVRTPNCASYAPMSRSGSRLIFPSRRFPVFRTRWSSAFHVHGPTASRRQAGLRALRLRQWRRCWSMLANITRVAPHDDRDRGRGESLCGRALLRRRVRQAGAIRRRVAHRG